MLLQLFESRSLILLIDGIDEAASLKTTVEDYITKTLVPAGHQVIVTSRPVGVRMRSYKNFVVINLTKLSQEQQNNAISTQLKESQFYYHLSSFSRIRKDHDKKYTGEGETQRGAMIARKAFVTNHRHRLSRSSPRSSPRSSLHSSQPSPCRCTGRSWRASRPWICSG